MTIRIELEIENVYVDHGTIVTTHSGEVPDPPSLDEGSEPYEEWAYDHIYCETGTGRFAGDAAYFVTVTGSSLPELVGRTFEWGV